MPIVYEDFHAPERREAHTIPSTRRQVLEEQFATVFEENPIKAVQRWYELSQDEKTGTKLDAASARQRIKDQGFEGHLTVNEGGITEAALDTLMERKRVELRRADVFSRAQGGLAEGASRFGLAALTTLADPISAGLNFVPVVGQTRYLNWLSRASFAKRAAIRAGVGAAEGTVGSAIAEIPVYAMRRSEQADYDMADSLLNVALGGIVGSGLHVTVGSVGELIARGRSAAQVRTEPGAAAAAEAPAAGIAPQTATASQAEAPVWYRGGQPPEQGKGRGGAIFFSESRELADHYSGQMGGETRAYEINVERPFDYKDDAAVIDVFAKVQELPAWKEPGNQLYQELRAGNHVVIERPEVQQAIRDLGHDSFYTLEHGKRNIGVFDLTRAVERPKAPNAAAEPAVPRGAGSQDNLTAPPADSAAAKVAAVSPETRAAAMRAAVGQAVVGDRINVDPILASENAPDAFSQAISTQRPGDSVPDPEVAAAIERADEVEANPVTDELKVAQEEADLATAEADAMAKRLDIEERDAELEAADELADTAERWAKAAEAATTCLIRGG